MRATRFLWAAAGCPAPCETEGTPILPRDLRVAADAARRKIQKMIDAASAVADLAAIARYERDLAAIVDDPHCASCGEPATNRISDAISDNFTTVKNACRAWAFGGTHVCQACLWCCKTIALRCALFFARADGFWFTPIRPIPGRPETRPDPLAALLNPPDPPFVAGLPLYGIDHGGEANAHRAIWPWTGDEDHPNVRRYAMGPRLFVPSDPLIKLQSKHTALYCQVSRSRDRYRLQVDDTGDITVDVAVWSRLRVICDGLLVELRAAGVGAREARGALETGDPPRGAPMAILVSWRARTAPLQPHIAGPWWKLFCNLLLMPDLTMQPQAEPTKAAKVPSSRATAAATAAVTTPILRANPAALVSGQISLF